MEDITSTTRSSAFGVNGGPVYIRMKGTFDGAVLGVYFSPEAGDNVTEASWDRLSDPDGNTFTDEKAFWADLPKGSISFKADSVGGSTSVSVAVQEINYA